MNIDGTVRLDEGCEVLWLRPRNLRVVFDKTCVDPEDVGPLSHKTSFFSGLLFLQELLRENCSLESTMTRSETLDHFQPNIRPKHPIELAIYLSRSVQNTH